MIPVPQFVLESLAGSFGTTDAHLGHFAGGRQENDGVIYSYPYHTGQRLLKIIAFPAQEQRSGLFRLEERLRFMRFLGENGAPIAFPLLSPQDNLYETRLSGSHLWVGYSMDIAPGETVKPTAWNAKFFCNWGQTIGMLHRLTQQYPSWKASLDPLTGEECLTWREEWQSFYDWCQDDDVRGKWAEIKDQLETLPIAREAYGFIHNDPHIWNLLVDGDRITVLDFDVANHHWFVNDIAIACQSVLFAIAGGMDRPLHDHEKLLAYLDTFLAGYAREHALPSEWLDRLDLFIAYRRILLFTVMYDWICSESGRHSSWKEMILSQPRIVGTLARE
jgi:Ser/Thr protein kinase RdoA (MazF antagonist)